MTPAVVEVGWTSTRPRTLVGCAIPNLVWILLYLSLTDVPYYSIQLQEFPQTRPSSAPPFPSRSGYTRERKELLEVRWWQNNQIFGAVSDVKQTKMPKFLAISLNRKELLDYDDVCDTAVQCYAWVTQPEHMKGAKDEVKEASRAAN